MRVRGDGEAVGLAYVDEPRGKGATDRYRLR